MNLPNFVKRTGFQENVKTPSPTKFPLPFDCLASEENNTKSCSFQRHKYQQYEMETTTKQRQVPIQGGVSQSGDYLVQSPHNPTLTKLNGCPIAQTKNSLTAGPNGPVVLEDHALLEKLKQFTREKIPARNVHALGTGAYGHFTVTNDITQYTCANLFSRVGEKTEIFARFSGIFTEQGDPDTNRDPRGFAIKFYTKEGNWDLLAINTPVFNVRDGKVGPDGVHSLKRDPRTGMYNPTQTWDHILHHPETLHFTTMLYSDRGGTPLSFRHMHAYGCNTYSFINSKNERFWVKFHLISTLGARGMDQATAKLVAGEDPNFLGRDLHQAIERGDFPKWRFCFQVMPEKEGYEHPWTFDCTKVWKHKDYPLIDIGIIEINRNPINYFAEVEQVAFSPANIVPGIGFSPDKLLQARLLLYDDAQHHRIGPNFKQLYINRPHATSANTLHYGGNMNLELVDKFPHYIPSSFGGPKPSEKRFEPPLRADGAVDYYDYPGEGSDWDYYGQAGDLFRLLSEQDRTNLCYNIATSWVKIPDSLVHGLLPHFYKIDHQYGSTVERFWREHKEGKAPKLPGEVAVEKLNQLLGHTQVKISP